MKYSKGFSKVPVIIGLVVAVFIALASFLVIDANNRSTNFDSYDFSAPIAADEHNGQIADHIKGDPSAPLLIVEYADYQCPGCASINPRINQIIENSDGQIAVIYRNYLLSYHQNATAAASAAEAAGIQGYWKPYADKLFTEQAEWEYASGSERTALFSRYFEEVTDGKGDVEKFNTDLASDAVSKKISFDMGIGKRIDVPSTPAFYIDGQYLDWTNKEGGQITIDNQTISWDSAITTDGLEGLLLKIVEAKTVGLTSN